MSFLPSVEHGGHPKEKVPRKLSQLSQFNDKSLVLLPPQGLRGLTAPNSCSAQPEKHKHGQALAMPAGRDAGSWGLQREIPVIL